MIFYLLLLGRQGRFHQRLDVCRGTGGERRQIVATFQHRNHAALAAFRRHFQNLLCQPAIIVLAEIKFGKRVQAVRVEARRNQNELRLELSQCGFDILAPSVPQIS